MATNPAEELFDTVNIEYEHQYSGNEVLLDFIHHTISLLNPNSLILDIGSGTGIPVAKTLLEAGMHVTGIDISQRMIEIAQRQVPGGTFLKADMTRYEPSGAAYDAVFMIFSHMQLSFRDFHAAMLKFAACLRPGGVFVLAALPAEKYVPDPAAYDPTGAYAEHLPAPFMDHVVETTLFTTEGMLAFLGRLGLDVVRHQPTRFVPKTSDAVPEDQYFIIARRTDKHPLLGPYPLPTTRPPRLTLNEDVWPQFAATVVRHDIDAVLGLLESNMKILDVGSGQGDLPLAIARQKGTCYALEPNPSLNTIILQHTNSPTTPSTLQILPGTASSIPLPPHTLDACIAMWILDHVPSLDAALVEIARVVDPTALSAKIVLVQASPDNELMAVLNAATSAVDAASPSVNVNVNPSSPDAMANASANHPGFLLHRATEIFTELGFGDISFTTVDLYCCFESARSAAEMLGRLFFRNGGVDGGVGGDGAGEDGDNGGGDEAGVVGMNEGRDEGKEKEAKIIAALEKELDRFFEGKEISGKGNGNGRGEVGDKAVIMVARPGGGRAGGGV